MAITIEQLAMHTGDKFKRATLESLLEEYYLLSMLEFENSATSDNSATLNYVYSRTLTESSAGKRDINANFTASEAVLEQIVAKLKPIGGNYTVDNAVAGTDRAASIVEFQQNQKLKATIKALFNSMINAKKATDGFDGVKETLLKAPFKTKQVIETTLDISAALTEANAYELISLLDELASKAKLKNGNGIIVANSKTILKIKDAGRRAGYYTRSENSFGVGVEMYNGVPLIDLEDLAGVDIVPVSADGTTSIYGIRLGIDATHGAAVMNPEGLFSIQAPDFAAASANGSSVAYGLVQIVTAIGFATTDCIASVEGLKVSVVG